ncbi:hypothetical protein DPSP01_011525 [Paraphaeosphaeria sporulosa]|uniref:Uncharacterized protein n=1 Tax=Paraphaeosphaeria sporulosa TaxID=1460663 RepID=A0A177C6F2_9PLEO|nr:uncharacterized protein CC84DRAFT_1022325 [Paraphaeosphaeria sporulosa]OAG02452.1 hypothetical protein CC84DRAFT_1022325 [Paraphaeosphaeria sporulosa]
MRATLIVAAFALAVSAAPVPQANSGSQIEGSLVEARTFSSNKDARDLKKDDTAPADELSVRYTRGGGWGRRSADPKDFIGIRQPKPQAEAAPRNELSPRSAQPEPEPDYRSTRPWHWEDKKDGVCTIVIEYQEVSGTG